MSLGYVFRLYVTGDAPNSLRARSNLAALAHERLAGQEHVIEEVDVLKEPTRALADNIMVTPTLVRLKPGPECRIIGNLSEREKVVAALGL
jgi:circadian clock protein KaiB